MKRQEKDLTDHLVCEKIRVQGLVQGVGFRPFVWRLAHQFNLNGEIFNDGEGVHILVCGLLADIESFTQSLQLTAPPLARIDRVLREPLNPPSRPVNFQISDSQGGDLSTGIVPDAATCPACIDEINDPTQRRYGYAFTNCTHCGPRLSIIDNIPYDRANTSMRAFRLCSLCQQEYDNPADRRFHAQPIACPGCGPRLQLCDNAGQAIDSDDAITDTAQLIRRGHLVAIKGIGGFQLACDAGNDEAVKELRRRKHRPHKALALMARDVDQVEAYCNLDQTSRDLLNTHQAPIVILPRIRSSHTLSAALAPGQHSLGFMLPYSPLHHLLMQHLDHPIVLTSGNHSEQPQCIDNLQALEQLQSIADYWLLHDRDIINRVDDSVLRIINGRAQFYRRARGYAPAPLRIPESLGHSTAILALGGELKNTFCLHKDGQAILSQHMGNLENVQTYEDYLANLKLYQRLYRFEPELIVVDKHPEYLSTKLGLQMADEQNLRLIEVQHHHAHIAACLLDNQRALDQHKVLGVTLDGLGYGDDGTLWGGEFLVADYCNYQRVARFRPTPMPGGSQAMREPWRNTLAQLWTHLDWIDVSHCFAETELLQYLSQKPLKTYLKMMETGTQAPMSSSCGRLFDAVAAAVGLCRDHISYEGQAAIELESQVDQATLHSLTPYPFELEQNDLLEINPAPMWRALLKDLQHGQTITHIATRFHLCLMQMIISVVQRISRHQGLDTVVLSGGVWQNSTLLELTETRLKQEGFTVLTHQQVPSNDGGLALGQTAIALARLQQGER